MATEHIAQGNKVVLTWDNGETRVVATCKNYDSTVRAAALLDQARFANDVKRQYTKAARLIAMAESMDGFTWVRA